MMLPSVGGAVMPAIFGHSRFVYQGSRLLLRLRHDSIVIAYTRWRKVRDENFTKSSKFRNDDDQKDKKKKYLPPTENTRRGELNHVIFVSTKVIIA